jgi:hypothetical protein
MTLIFLDPADGILFQVYSGAQAGLVTKPYLLYNENVAFFDRYAAVYFSYLLTYLEDVSEAILSHFGLMPTPANVHNYSPGYAVLERWTQELVVFLRQQAATE